MEKAVVTDQPRHVGTHMAVVEDTNHLTEVEHQDVLFRDKITLQDHQTMKSKQTESMKIQCS